MARLSTDSDRWYRHSLADDGVLQQRSIDAVRNLIEGVARDRGVWSEVAAMLKFRPENGDARNSSTEVALARVGATGIGSADVTAAVLWSYGLAASQHALLER